MGDAVVVGAGIVGLATAWELSKRGVAVTVLDPSPASGASHAAAGMLAPISEVRFQQEALWPLMTASGAEYGAFVQRIEEESDLSVGHRATETLVVAGDRTDVAELEALHELQIRHGMEVRRISSRTARQLEPALSPRISGAVCAASDHQLDPRRLTRALSTALERRGAFFVPETAVRIGTEGAHPVVHTAAGTVLTADAVILAPGLGLRSIQGLPEPLELPLRPVHGDILRTRVPPGRDPLIERTVRALVNGSAVYLVPREDGEVVIGATTREDASPAVSAGGVWKLLDDAKAVVPGVAELEFCEAVARARPGTPDDLPYVGRVRGAEGAPVPGLFVSTGHFRHGVLLAPLSARLIGDLVTQGGAAGDEDAGHLRAADPARHQTFGRSAHRSMSMSEGGRT